MADTMSTDNPGMNQLCKQDSIVSVGVVAERVRALDWQPGGSGFESRCGNFASELWQFRLPRLASVFWMRH